MVDIPFEIHVDESWHRISAPGSNIHDYQHVQVDALLSVQIRLTRSKGRLISDDEALHRAATLRCEENLAELETIDVAGQMSDISIKDGENGVIAGFHATFSDGLRCLFYHDIRETCSLSLSLSSSELDVGLLAELMKGLWGAPVGLPEGVIRKAS